MLNSRLLRGWVMVSVAVKPFALGMRSDQLRAQFRHSSSVFLRIIVKHASKPVSQ
jgi:hypothetical protein